MALAWLAQRALGVETPLRGAIEAVFGHGMWILAGLAALALLPQVRPRRPASA